LLLHTRKASPHRASLRRESLRSFSREAVRGADQRSTPQKATVPRASLQPTPGSRTVRAQRPLGRRLRGKRGPSRTRKLATERLLRRESRPGCFAWESGEIKQGRKTRNGNPGSRHRNGKTVRQGTRRGSGRRIVLYALNQVSDAQKSRRRPKASRLTRSKSETPISPSEKSFVASADLILSWPPSKGRYSGRPRAPRSA
jgi:hypothetical protein